MQQYNLSEILRSVRGKHIHLVGIKGTGMAALVEILAQRGAVITGSDVSDVFYTDEILAKFGISALPFGAANITDDLDLVIYSAAYNADQNADLATAQKKNIPTFLYTEALGCLSEKSYSCAISGVHGKTSTTGLVGSILAQLDLGAQVLAGSVITSFDGSCTLTTKHFAFAEGDLASGTQNTAKNASNIFVAETCEYKRHFLSFAPQIIVVTSIESDHQDYYPTYESMLQAFVEFAEKLPAGGKLIFCAEDAGAAELAKILEKKREDLNLIGYGQKTSGPYKLEFGKIANGVQDFFVTLPSLHGEPQAQKFALQVPGKHEVRDATAAIALCCELLLQNEKNPCDSNYIEKIAAGLLSFAGGKRRSEIIGRGHIGKNSVIVLDDYAHHPTAIKTTLAGFRDFYPRRKIIVSFMSHTYTRTAALLQDFAASFDDADCIILHKIYGSARENMASTNGLTGRTLFEKTKEKVSEHNAQCQAETCVFYFEEPCDCVDFAVQKMSEPLPEKYGDGYLFVTMGAGDNWKAGQAICDLLKKSEAAV